MKQKMHYKPVLIKNDYEDLILIYHRAMWRSYIKLFKVPLVLSVLMLFIEYLINQTYFTIIITIMMIFFLIYMLYFTATLNKKFEEKYLGDILVRKIKSINDESEILQKKYYYIEHEKTIERFFSVLFLSTKEKKYEIIEKTPDGNEIVILQIKNLD